MISYPPGPCEIPPMPVYLEANGMPRQYFSDYATAERWGRDGEIIPRRIFRATDGVLLGHRTKRGRAVEVHLD